MGCEIPKCYCKLFTKRSCCFRNCKKGLFMSDYHKQNLINGLVEGGKKINKNGNVIYSISVENATDIVEKLIPSE